tara:strand:- start:746 stop:1024 length:279 start_codon:yes stop_codon:yes gene_type:complete
MSTNISKITVDENNNGFTLGAEISEDGGSLFVKQGEDYILQDSLSTGVGFLIVNISETNSSGELTLNLPDNVLGNTDKNFELDENNDITPKT